MMNERPYLTSEPTLQLAMELEALRQRVAALEAQEMIAPTAGVWTPEIRGSTANGTVAYTSQGVWRAFGPLCWIQADITVSAITVAPTGNLEFHGLPPTPTVLGGWIGFINIAYWNAVLPTNYTDIEGNVYSFLPNPYIRPIRSGSGVASAEVQGSELRTGLWRLAGAYRLV